MAGQLLRSTPHGCLRMILNPYSGGETLISRAPKLSIFGGWTCRPLLTHHGDIARSHQSYINTSKDSSRAFVLWPSSSNGARWGGEMMCCGKHSTSALKPLNRETGSLKCLDLGHGENRAIFVLKTLPRLMDCQAYRRQGCGGWNTHGGLNDGVFKLS